MQAIINFVAVRPVFTHYGLKLVWYVYLLNAAMQVYTSLHGIFQALAQRGISVEAWSPNLVPIILGIFVQLLLVRLLIEVAAMLLAGRQTPSNK